MLTEPELLEKLSGIEHFLCDGQAYWLYQKAYELPDFSNILEIGCFHGCSTAAMALGCEGTNKHVYVVDSDRKHISKATEHWVRLGVGMSISAFGVDSSDIIRLSETWGFPKFDFAFIDGDHVGKAPERDLKNVLKLMKPYSHLAMHDVIDTWPDVEQTWKRCALPRLRKLEYVGSIACGQV
jgi:predicted O-methyltransferase YrrM